MLYQQLASLFAIVLTFVAFVPYIRAILKNDTQPHVFSWIIWGFTTVIVFFAQLEDGAGIGAWPIGISGAITLFIALLAYLKRGDASITRTDWLFFTAALSSIPLWFFTDNPLWAVVILTVVDLLGFGPTFRKSYRDPHSESILFFSLFVVRNSLVLVALENMSLTTALMPASVTLACVVLILMIILRRTIN